jgi:hypothetical protein
LVLALSQLPEQRLHGVDRRNRRSIHRRGVLILLTGIRRNISSNLLKWGPILKRWSLCALLHLFRVSTTRGVRISKTWVSLMIGVDPMRSILFVGILNPISFFLRDVLYLIL